MNTHNIISFFKTLKVSKKTDAVLIKWMIILTL